MISHRYETIVGIFVLASLVALLAMVVIIAKQEGLFQEYVKYRTVFKNVGGLKTGSEVRLAGVTVGNVTNISINPEGNIVVTFQVFKKYSDRIRRDSQATIGFMGLLGEKSLDVTTGSPSQPAVPPEGTVVAVEPLDLTQLLAKAAPSLEDIQKILNNLANLTSGISGVEFRESMEQLRQIFTKVNQGKGTLGLIINDPALYKETTLTVAAIQKTFSDLDKGLFGTPAFKEKTQSTLTNFQSTAAKASETASHLKEAAARLPNIAQKLEAFLNNLDKAGKNLPGLMTDAETLVGDMDKTTKAIQKSWLLRRYVPTPQEHTIRLDGDPGKD